MDLSLSEIVESINGEILINNNHGNFNKISTDTRKIEKDNLFIALRGSNFNGNEYVIHATQKGASIIIIDEIKFKVEELNNKVTIIKVKDTKSALGDLARFYRKKIGIKVVGITGSTGKTSTKDLVAAFLSGKYKVFKTQGNFNNEIGLPLMILELSKEYDIAVLEMGTSNFGEINNLSRIACPNISAITNIGVAHIEYLKSRENILKEKMCITDFFEDKNSLIINCENDMLKTVNKGDKFNLEKIGYDEEYDLHAKNIQLTSETTAFDVITKNKEIHRFNLNMAGEHNVLNALIGIQIARDLGLTFDEMEKGLENFNATSMRLEIIKKNDFTLINDSYNANPDSMKAALKVLENYSGKRKIAVLGSMGELGDYAKESHTEVGKFAKGKANVLLTTGDYKECYKKGFKEGAMLFNTKHELMKELSKLIKKGDTILVKASRNEKFEEIIKYIEK